MASLSISGALHASPSTLIYRPFSDWGSDIWSTSLPEGENVLCVAAGRGFAAAATSAQLLRTFSPAGAQTAVLALTGPAVCLAAQPEGRLLAAVTHAAAPDAATRSQRLRLEVYDTAGAGRLIERCELALSPGSTLSWLGFTSDGLPCTADSTGVLRVRSPQYGGAWVPVLDTEAAARASEAWWPVGLSGDALTCIVCPRSHPHPVLHPRPIFTRTPLRLPLLAVEGGRPELESDLLLRSITGSALHRRLGVARGAAGRPAEVGVSVGGFGEGGVEGVEEEAGLEEELRQHSTEVDACLLKLVHAALEGGCQVRAVQDGAWKIVLV